MPDLPIILNVKGKRCVVVGGGATAQRRAQALIEAGADVTLIDPQAGDAMPHGLVRVVRPYRTGDLDGAMLVVIATDDPAVNAAVTADAFAVGALVNRADDPRAGNVAFPAVARRGPVTIAADTSGISASAASAIRDELATALDDSWVQLLEIAAPFRRRIQQAVADPVDRQESLRQLTDDKARQILKMQGSDSLRQYLESLAS